MNTKVTIAGVEFKNPVMVASGTFGSGEEFSEFVDLNRLGAVVTKGVANVPWPGNPTPRIAEVRGGMLNAIGLQNPGIDLFIKRDIPFLQKYDTRIIVNVCGKSTEDYCEVVERLADAMRLSVAETESLLERLQTRYDEEERGFALLRFGPDRWQMTTRPYYGVMVKRILDTRRNAPLSPAALEVLRELLNFETNTEKLLQIVIFGQPELAQIIEGMPNFKDRINEYLYLKPLSMRESIRLVRHRLRLA